MSCPHVLCFRRPALLVPLWAGMRAAAAGMRKRAFPVWRASKAKSRARGKLWVGESRLGPITAAAAAAAAVIYSLFQWDNCVAARAPYFTRQGDEREGLLSVYRCGVPPSRLVSRSVPSHLHSMQQVIAATWPTMEPSFHTRRAGPRIYYYLSLTLHAELDHVLIHSVSREFRDG